jgi:glycosyltransferase involved in cell wall biosynthesis
MSPEDVTVVICTIPVRPVMLGKAIASVLNQTVTPGAIVVRYDHAREGHAINRNKAMEQVNTEWLAFLDDDDEWDTTHLEQLCNAANEHPEADLIYPWHRIAGPDGGVVADMFGRQGLPFDEQVLRRDNFIPVTVLVRTDVIRAVQFPSPAPYEYYWKAEDFGCWVRMLDNGATFYHHPEITWTWNHHGNNTSGQGDRW